MTIKTQFKIVNATEQGNFRNYGSKEVVLPFIIMVVADGIVVDTVSTNGARNLAFASFEDADIFLQNMDREKYQYDAVLVFNQDFIEGYGPMRFHKAFASVTHAHNYIMSQHGRYGSTQRHNVFFGCDNSGTCYVSVTYNGYDLTCIKFEN